MKTKTTRKISKRGQVGLDVAKSVILSVVVLAVFGFAIIISFANISDSGVSATSGTGSKTDTLTSVAHSLVAFTTATLEDCSATVIEARNITNLALIPASNYTVTGCAILYKTGQGNANGYNNSNWQVNYTYTFDSFGTVKSNITTGTTSFFNNTGTWFALLAVVVVILIISIVIVAVNRFGGRSVSLS